MDDIILPQEEKDDDSILIRPMEDDDKEMDVDFSKTSLGDADLDMPNSMPTTNRVTVNFAKFVQLVANHSFVDIVEKNAEEEVIVSGNLLTDLANSHDRGKEKRMPIMFLGGLVLGIILTYIILH